MKKLTVLLATVMCLSSFTFSIQGNSQTHIISNPTNPNKGLSSLIGRWEIIGTKNEGGGLEVIDSTHIIMTYDGQRKQITGFTLDFSKSPMWFDFFVKDGDESVQVKSIMEIISDDLIKWQVFMDEDRSAHFTTQKGEMFYLKRQKIKTVVAVP